MPDSVGGGAQVSAQVCDRASPRQPAGDPCQHGRLRGGAPVGQPVRDHHTARRGRQTWARSDHGLLKGIGRFVALS